MAQSISRTLIDVGYKTIIETPFLEWAAVLFIATNLESVKTIADKTNYFSNHSKGSSFSCQSLS